MASELTLQRKLIEETNRLGGYAQKLSNRFLVGVPDLLLHLPGLPTAFIECKLEVLPARPTTPIKINLSPQQRAVLKKMQAADMVAGWCVFVANKSGSNPDWYWILYGRDTNVTELRQGCLAGFETRKRGEPWPVKTIIRNLTCS